MCPGGVGLTPLHRLSRSRFFLQGVERRYGACSPRFFDSRVGWAAPDFFCRVWGRGLITVHDHVRLGWTYGPLSVLGTPSINLYWPTFMTDSSEQTPAYVLVMQGCYALPLFYFSIDA